MTKPVYWQDDKGNWYVKRCINDHENYALAVASGTCYLCGWQPEMEEKHE